MSTVVWITGALALPAVASVVAGTVVSCKAIRTLHKISEETRGCTGAKDKQHAVEFAKMITRVATERTGVGRWGSGRTWRSRADAGTDSELQNPPT